jgi:hypothetical protein
LNTAAQLHHYHDVQGRPNQYQYGKMVVRNGWYVWRVKIQIQNGETGSSGMPLRIVNGIDTNAFNNTTKQALLRLWAHCRLVEFCFNKPIKNRNEVCTLHKCFASSS